MTTRLHGGCLCGAVRYVVEGAPAFSFACHCTDCQRLTASAFSLGLAAHKNRFTLTQGEPIRWTKRPDSGKPSHMFRCAICGCMTHTLPEGADPLLMVRASSLDDRSWFRPVAEIWTRSALPWARMPALFAFDGEFEETAPLEAAFRDAAMTPNVETTERVGRPS